MGGGSWTRDKYTEYSRSVGRSVDASGSVSGNFTAQEMFTQRKLAEELNPKGVIRECCDSTEHPNSSPVILALDVTGSMGSSAVETAKKLNVIMSDLYTDVPDIEFMVMGIGDLSYDKAPLQVSQFESDIRIAEQLDKVWFEGNGGGNMYESYTVAWYFASRHVSLDCWKRGKKGLIITMGDEIINPYLPARRIEHFIGDSLQGDINTGDMYREASEKYDIYHLVVEHGMASRFRSDGNRKSFEEYLGKDHVRVVNLDNIAEAIIDIIRTKYATGTTDDVPDVADVAVTGTSNSIFGQVISW